MKYSHGIVIIIFLLVVGGLLFFSNKKSENARISQAGDNKISIVTSFYPLEFALKRIVGDLGVVTNVGAGKDPHDFEPTTKDILTMQKADAVVLQGADFEHWGDDVMARLKADDIPVILATKNIKLQKGGSHHDHHEEDIVEHQAEKKEGEHGHEHGMYDPHTWLDPVLFSEMVGHMANELATIDPEHKSTYQANALKLQNDLAVLDAEYKKRLKSCQQNEVITTHEALGYLAHRYNFEVHSIAGLSTEDTPSAITLATLKEEAKEGVNAILLEENSIASYGKTLARETGLKTLSFNPVEYVVPRGKDYLSIMKSNLNTLSTALNCNG